MQTFYGKAQCTVVMQKLKSDLESIDINFEF